MRIGFFDSGIGGITVLREALRLMPDEDYLYYADTANLPYGTKSKEEVRRCVLDAADFIADQGVRALVIACNTATSVAVGDLRERYDFPVIGMEPAVKPAAENNGVTNKRILVTATPLTLKEEKLHNLIARFNGKLIDLLPLPGLVTLAESFNFDRGAVYPYLRESLSAYNLNDYDAVVLGCTHFIFFKETFREIVGPNIGIYDGNVGTVKNLSRLLADNSPRPRGTGDIVFFNSGVKVKDAETDRYRRLLQLP